MKYRNVEIIPRFLTPDEAVRQFQLASIIVAPYRDATQSGVVAAAFANGRHVVASRVGGLVDAVLHGINGLLVRPNDPGDLAEALERMLLDDELHKRLSGGAREARATAFEWKAIGTTMMQAYCELH